MTGYLTAAGSGRAEYEDKRSRFLSRVESVSTEEEAKAVIARVRREYPDATHHVYAYLLRQGNVMRWSDDGEPGGTSGQPTLWAPAGWCAPIPPPPAWRWLTRAPPG